MGLKTWESYESLSELHKKKANKENLNLIKIEKPLTIDDHQLHIDEHIRFLISSESDNLTEDEKSKILEHIKQHKTLSKNQGE